MTNREENLKKINEQLEQLTDEQLEQVAGGTIPQTAEDSQFLYKHGLVISCFFITSVPATICKVIVNFP